MKLGRTESIRISEITRSPASLRECLDEMEEDGGVWITWHERKPNGRFEYKALIRKSDVVDCRKSKA
jgi:hypothetical protein